MNFEDIIAVGVTVLKLGKYLVIKKIGKINGNVFRSLRDNLLKIVQ